MVNNFAILVEIGFLSNAIKQLEVAQDSIQDTYMEDEFADFRWNFNNEAKKLDFDYYYYEYAIKEFISSKLLSNTYKKSDVLIISFPDGYFYCSCSRKAMEEATVDNYNTAGLIPYYTVKRKINGKMMWLCLIFPFVRPNYN